MMHSRGPWLRRGLASFGLAAPLALAQSLPVTVHAADAVVGAPDMAAVVGVADVHADAGTVSGKLVNRSDDTLTNVELLVSDTFIGTKTAPQAKADPSRATRAKVQGPIPPRGTLPFRLERPATLPDRSDGTFETAVTVTSVTRQAAAPSLPPNVR